MWTKSSFTSNLKNISIAKTHLLFKNLKTLLKENDHDRFDSENEDLKTIIKKNRSKSGDPKISHSFRSSLFIGIFNILNSLFKISHWIFGMDELNNFWVLRNEVLSQIF